MRASVPNGDRAARRSTLAACGAGNVQEIAAQVEAVGEDGFAMSDQNAEASHGDLLRMTAEVVAAYVANNEVATKDVPAVITSVHRTLTELNLGGAAASKGRLQKAAVSVRRSVTPDYLICLEDGKKLKMLKRHLRNHGMTPEEYLAKWGLPPDYPMVAPNYAAQRSAFAKKIGLGRTSGSHSGGRSATRQ